MTTQLTVLHLAPRSPEAPSSAPVTGEATEQLAGRRLKQEKPRNSQPRVLLVVFPGLTASLLLALLYILVLFRFSISVKTSYPSFPALSLSLNPYKGLKLAVSSGACHSHSSLC